jgi:hypothetical protein
MFNLGRKSRPLTSTLNSKFRMQSANTRTQGLPKINNDRSKLF